MLVGKGLELVENSGGEDRGGIDGYVVDRCNVDNVINLWVQCWASKRLRCQLTCKGILECVIARGNRAIENWVDTLVETIGFGLCIHVFLGNEVIIGADNGVRTATNTL